MPEPKANQIFGGNDANESEDGVLDFLSKKPEKPKKSKSLSKLKSQKSVKK